MYDNCETGVPGFNTKWTMMLGLNFITYAALSVCTGLMLVGVIFPPITLCGFIGHCCGCLLQLAAIVVTAVYRYN